MKITLCTPSSHQVYRNIKRSSKRQPTLGPAYILGALAQHGFEVAYIDADALDLVQEHAIDAILATDPDIIGFSLTTPLFSETKDLARGLRQRGWKGHITLGGAHPTYLPEESLTLIPETDSAVIGEGEDVIVNLAQAINAKQPLDNVNVAFRHPRTGEIIGTRHGKHHTLAKDLDALALPAFEYYPMGHYISPMWSGSNLERMGVLVTTRGCPFLCDFCASGADSVVKFRYHSIDRVMLEIRRLVHDFKVDYLVLNDDTYTVNKKRCYEISRLMQSEGLQIPFMMTSRVNTVDYELLKTLRDAGCFLVTYGIESGSQQILKSIGKTITLEQVRFAIETTQKLGMKAVGNFMFGHWDDTQETCQQTLDFALDLGCDITQFAVTIPYPGTQLHRRASAAKRVDATSDYSNFGYYGNAPWEHPRLSREELVGFQKQAYEATKRREAAMI